MTIENSVLQAIYERRSVRKYTGEPVSAEELEAILEAARWAPSGKNNQPWRFVIVTADAKKEELSRYTHYSSLVNKAPMLIAVFLDPEACYDALKDAQGAGACLQNMLLAAHSMGLGAVWLGEILRNGESVRQSLGAPEGYQLQAVVAVGRPDTRNQRSHRSPVEELIIGRFE